MAILVPGPESDLLTPPAPTSPADGLLARLTRDDDVDLLSALREAKAWFRAEICRQSALTDGAELQRLRRDPTYQIAEMLYLLRAHGPLDHEGVRQIARGHNESLVRLADRDDSANTEQPHGIDPNRLQWAVFTEDRIEKLAENWVTKGAIDQSDLGRLMVKYMSLETCRQTIALLERAGFFKRLKSPYGAKLARSTGVLEALFARHLRAIWWFAIKHLENSPNLNERAE